MFHTIVDAGNDATYSAAGLNLWDWLGIDFGASTNEEVYAQLQVTPWLHASVSLGLPGLGVTIGVNSDNVSYDFSIHAGMIAVLAVCVYFGVDPGAAYAYSYG